MAREKKCHFILPWWEFLPQLIPGFISRIIIASKMKSKTENFEPDYFGVSFEVKIVQRVGVPVLVSYLIYASFSMKEGVDSKFPCEYILMVLPITGCLCNVTVPCIKTVLKKKHRKRSKHFAQTLVVKIQRTRHSLCEAQKGSPVTILLCSTNSKEVDEFKKHAQRAFCGESVDFCSEVLAYRNMCSRTCLESMKEKHILHEKFLEIVNEFVRAGASSEVNISSSQKQDILKFKDVEFFASLSPSQIISIFDVAEKEIERLLEPILRSFETMQNAACPSSKN